MKKLLYVLMVMFLLTGCGNDKTSNNVETQSVGTEGITKVETNNITKVETKSDKQKFDSDAVAAQIAIAEYKYKSDWFMYHFVEATNNSEYTVNIEVNILYYDSEDKLISAETRSEEVIEPGYSALLLTMPDEDFARTEISLNVDESKYYSPIQSDIECTVNPAKEKLVIQAKNIGEEPAEFVEISALFFDGDDVVGYDGNYFVDDDSELKPGKTISQNLEAYHDFDGYKYYISGRRHK